MTKQEIVESLIRPLVDQLHDLCDQHDVDHVIALSYGDNCMAASTCDTERDPDVRVAAAGWLFSPGLDAAKDRIAQSIIAAAVAREEAQGSADDQVRDSGDADSGAEAIEAGQVQPA